MGRKTVLKTKGEFHIGPTAEQIAEALADYNLEVGQQVRFRMQDGETWDYGKVNRVEKDGSIGLFSEGRFRSIVPERLQIQKVGPRGGRTWENLT